MLRYIAISKLDEERLARYANTANGALRTHRFGVLLPEKGVHAPPPNLFTLGMNW